MTRPKWLIAPDADGGRARPGGAALISATQYHDVSAAQTPSTTVSDPLIP